MENPNLFLKKKYDLHKAPEVESAAKRTEALSERRSRLRDASAGQAGQKEKVPQDPSSRIQNYLDRFKEITDRKDPAERERGLEAIKRILYRDNIIKPQDIPESYWDTQRRLAREQGHGDIEITDDIRKQQAEILITDQKTTLDTWIDYLASPDATYPDWLKYWAIRSVLGIGEYDKEKKEFTRRSKGTVKPFPDINREALAYVLDVIEKKYQGQNINLPVLEAQDKAEFAKLLQGENFAKLYAWAIEKVTPASVDQLTITTGKWIKYQKGSDHTPLVQSLQGHGTGWCTAGESTAQAQLQGGDFYVYYSLDQAGKPTIPRAAIRMQENQIAEVRGIAPNQNLDPYIGEVVQKKMQEFPDGQEYEKKAKDMEFLTTIDNKTKANQPLSKDELIFLYEINNPIEGFGYQIDPRIKELRDQRNPKEDAPIVFGCSTQEIAWNQKEISKNTKAYIGPLFKGIFTKLNNLENIYTSFPEGKTRRESIEIGGKDAQQLEKELVQAGFKIGDYAKFMMNSKEFKTQKKSEQAKLVRLKVQDLFNDNKTHSTDDIYNQAKKLGLDLCPAEVGPHYRLQYKNQPLNEWFRIAMKQISDPDGRPRVFYLERVSGGVWLNYDWARPTSKWRPESGFVFRLPSPRK